MDPEIIKRYATDDVTVIWQPHKCSHSGICFRGLPEVFDPRRRPWVDVTAADTAAVVAQVDRCPSGALSWTPITPHPAPAPSDAPVPAGAGAAVIVEPLPNGPLVVHGMVTVRAADGSDTARERRTAFCRCGQSSTKPYCDGSHAAAGFTG